MDKFSQKSRLAKATIRHEALKLFKAKGYNATTIKDICKASGYSVGAFYHHYESKASIIDSTYRDFDARLEEAFDDFAFESMRDGINALMEHQTQAILEAGLEITSIQFREQVSHGEKFIVDEQRYQIQKLKRFIEAGMESKEFRSDLDPLAYAYTLMRISIGDVYVWCLSNGSFDLLKTVEMDIKHIIDDMTF